MRQFFKLRGKRAQSGDTIVEVVLALTVLGLVLSAASVTANRNSRTLQDTQERSYALRLAQGQLERIKAQERLPAGGAFCVGSNDEVRAAAHADCQRTEGGAGYTQSVIIQGVSEDSGYEARALISWESLLGYESSVEQTYRFYAEDIGGTPMVDNATTNIKPGYRGGTIFKGSCPAGTVGNYPSDCHVPCPPGWGGNPQTGCLEPCPPGHSGTYKPNCALIRPATIWPGSANYPAWHLYNTGGTKRTVTFYISNQAGSGTLQLTNAVISPNSTNFQIVNNACANKQLAAGAQCTVTVQFYPPSGGANNRHNNAGDKAATLIVNNSSGVAASTASLTGKAYSDRLVPGDIMFMGSEIRSYDPACYNNAAACGYRLAMQWDTNLVLYANSTALWWTGINPGGNGRVIGVWAQMQGDGHLVKYMETHGGSYPGGEAVWASHSLIGGNYRAGDWLQLHSNGYLNFMRSNGASYFNIWPTGWYY